MAGESILIVEDESVVALNISQVVRSVGYRPIGPVATGAGALKLFGEESVDLVLMDVKLKGAIDGIELAKQMYDIRPLPIIFLSAYTDEQTIARAKAVQPFGYITKSFDDGELHSTIEMALYKFSMEQKIVNEERLLAATLDNILEGVITTDSAGQVRYMNPAAVKLLGVDFKQAGGNSLDRLVKLVGTDGTPVSPFELVDQDGNAEVSDHALTLSTEGARSGLPVEWKATRIRHFATNEAEIVHVVRDLTARRKAEAAQRRLVSLVEFSDDAIITVSPAAIIESWNTGAEKIFGYTAGEAVGRELAIITHRFVPLDMTEAIARVASGQVIEPFELVCARKDGRSVDIAVKLQAMPDFTESIGSISFIARDVTARKNLDKMLREILNREQSRIGRDLHDSIGQMITGVLFKTKAMEDRLRSKSLPGEAEGISDIKELLTATLLRLRELARGLIPATIRSDGLIYALQRLVRDTGSLSGISVELLADTQSADFNELASSEIYHIVEEALNNAVKHSMGDEIVVAVRRLPEEVVVSVRDNGGGIPEQNTSGGLGLKIMRHRAELIGASLSVTSSKAGTEVVCRLPAERAYKTEE